MIVTAFGLRIAIYRVLKEMTDKLKTRKIIVSRIVNFSLLLITGLVLLGIWEVDSEDLVLFLASVFTVIGVAFFAQWSHLSNITAGIIIFFSNPVKIGDRIVIHDSSPVEGTITNIGLFFVSILTEENQQLMLTNTVFMQKMWSIGAK